MQPGFFVLLTMRCYVEGMRSGYTLWLAGFLSLAQVLGLSSSVAAQELISLEITGDPGSTFRGDCRIASAGKPEKRYRIQGKVPAKYWIPGAAIRCSLEKSNLTSRLTAQVLRGDMVEVQTVSPPPMRWLSVTSSGPWGAAKGVASASRPLWQ